MGRIGIHNYEAFLLDKAEGKLNEEELGELQNFLVMHPELDPGYFDLPVLFAEKQLAFFKEAMLKTEEAHPDFMIFSYVEGQVTVEEARSIETRMASETALAAEVELYFKTWLVPEVEIVFEDKEWLLKGQGSMETVSQANIRFNADRAVIFPGKAELLRSAKVVWLNPKRVAVLSAAAALMVVLFMFLFNYFDETLPSPTNSTAKIDSKIVLQEAIRESKNLTVSKAPDIFRPAKAIHRSTFVKKNELVTESGRPEKNVLAAITLDSVRIETTTQTKVLTPPGLKSPLQDTSTMIVVNSLAQLPVDDDNEEEESASAPKSSLWKKAVNIFRNLNRLGVKSVEGEEVAANNYRLSVNDFTIEKK